jgi:predicted transcriptional regulator of viral defense system
MTSAVASLQALRRLGQPIVRTRDAADLLGISAGSATRLLTRLASEGAISKVGHGLWAISETIDAFVVGSWITQPAPSYVSFYSALRYHGIIQQLPGKTYVASIAKSREVRTAAGIFSVHQVAPAVFGGFLEDRGRRIATPEKAVFDTLYLRRARGGRFRGLTEVELSPHFSIDQLRSYLGRITDPSLRTLVATGIERFLLDAE